ncbi:hypothetical protein F5H01DRAFT_108207 [Linnemannia elongata]|nr:hypothetical protein F5H01DRAFT_108207 [Linnemannia elongata]
MAPRPICPDFAIELCNVPEDKRDGEHMARYHTNEAVKVERANQPDITVTRQPDCDMKYPCPGTECTFTTNVKHVIAVHVVRCKVLRKEEATDDSTAKPAKLSRTFRAPPPYPVALSSVPEHPLSFAIGSRSCRPQSQSTQVRVRSSVTPSLLDETIETTSFQQPQQPAPPSPSPSAIASFDNRPYLEGLKSLESRLEVLERVVSFTRSDLKTVTELMSTIVQKTSDLISQHQGYHQDILAAMADIKASNEEVRTYFDSLPLNLPQNSGLNEEMTFREYVVASNKLRKNLQAWGPGSDCSSICSAHLSETSEHMVANQIAPVQRQQEEVYEHMGDVDGSKDAGEERVDKGKGRKEVV